MTVNQARKILGRNNIYLADKELESVVKKIRFLAETVYEDIDKNGVPDSFISENTEDQSLSK